MAKFRQILAVLLFAWKYRAVIWSLIKDGDDMVVGCRKVMSAYHNGLSGTEEAQTAVKELLALDSFTKLVLVTETLSDDDALANTRACVADYEIFSVGWRLAHGDWDIGVDQSRWSRFIDRIRSVLPFTSAAEASRKLALSDADPMAEETEIGVIEIVSIVSLIMNVLPKIYAIIKNRREKRGVK